MDPKIIEPILGRHADTIQAYSFITFDAVRKNNIGISSIQMSDRARLKKLPAGVYGVLPNVFDAMLSEFLVMGSNNQTSGLGLVEQLYTARGSQGLGVGTSVAESARVQDPMNNYNSSFILSTARPQKN